MWTPSRLALGFVAFLVLAGPFAVAQKKSRAQLEQERRRLESDMELTRKLLGTTQSNRQKSQAELRLIEKEIALQERYLETVGSEVEALEAEVIELQGLTTTMRGDIVRLQKNYAAVLYHSYKLQSEGSELLWLLSASSFSQAYNRFLYLREFSRFRVAQIGLIRRANQRLADREAAIRNKLSTKQQLLDQRKSETTRLATAKKQKQTVFTQLRKQEGSYSKQLKEYQAALKAVQKQVTNFVEEDVKKTAAVTGTARKGFIRVTGQFEKNKGKLPWPVQSTRGVVTGYFGTVKDESGGITENNGIYITTSQGQEVRAVFGGKVTGVYAYPNLGKLVMVQHGDYRTVYVNMDDVTVKVGDRVIPLATIGTVHANASGTAELQFLIYFKNKALDPLRWIARKN